MTDIEKVMQRLEVYKTRLFAMKRSHVQDINEIMFFEKEIDLMEAEIAVDELLSEMMPAKMHTLKTDCTETVRVLCAEERVIEFRMFFSFRHFKFMYEVDFFYRKR